MALYVDDVTYGADSLVEAFLLYTKSKLWLKEGLSHIHQCCKGGSIYKSHVQSTARRSHLHIRTVQ